MFPRIKINLTLDDITVGRGMYDMYIAQPFWLLRAKDTIQQSAYRVLVGWKFVEGKPRFLLH